MGRRKPTSYTARSDRCHFAQHYQYGPGEHQHEAEDHQPGEAAEDGWGCDLLVIHTVFFISAEARKTSGERIPGRRTARTRS